MQELPSQVMITRVCARESVCVHAFSQRANCIAEGSQVMKILKI